MIITETRIFRSQFIKMACLSGSILIFVISTIRVVVTDFPISRLFITYLVSGILLGIFLRERKGTSAKWHSYFILISYMLIIINGGISNGGMKAPIVAGTMLFPIFGGAALGRKGAWYGLFACAFSLLTISLLQYFDLTFPYQSQNELLFFPLMYLGAGSIALATILSFENARIAQQNEILKMTKDLAHAARLSATGEMASGMAHEINNPLGIVSGATELIRMRLNKDKIDMTKINAYLNKITQATARIARIIDSLRQFTSTHSHTTPSPVLLAQVVEETLGLCREKIADKKIELKIQIDPQIVIRSSGSQISQCLYTLISNSIDAIDELAEKWIQIESQKVENTVRLIVTDSGRGLSEEVQDRLMQPFFTTKPTGQGVGLGLSIARGIVQLHGGRLWCNHQSENTQFVIELPLNT